MFQPNIIVDLGLIKVLDCRESEVALGEGLKHSFQVVQ